MTSLGISSLIEFLSHAIIGVGYIKSGNLFPEPLTSEEEKIYLEQMKNGDDEARKIRFKSYKYGDEYQNYKEQYESWDEMPHFVSECI